VLAHFFVDVLQNVSPVHSLCLVQVVVARDSNKLKDDLFTTSITFDPSTSFLKSSGAYGLDAKT
jgi:hypothetical protein